MKNKLTDFQADWAAMPQVEKEQIQKLKNSVDYILTHMPSGKINRFINLDSNFYSECMDYFDTVSQKASYTKWYFGNLHLDKFISPKVQAVYTDVLPLWEEEKKGIESRRQRYGIVF